MATDFDLVIIGGGINGTGIARDAAGRGVSVLLVEMGDLASGTSSASTKLIHGGLRYLEYYAFGLVRKALKEREVLWGAAPHVIWPLRFILPHHDGLRPAWLLRLGLFLYDHLGGRKLLPATRTVRLDEGPFSQGLKTLFRRGFEYSDCWVDDARMVVLNARDAADRGARILTRTRFAGAERRGDHWEIRLEDRTSGQEQRVTARVLVNGAGPWVDQVLAGAQGRNRSKVRLVKGSHVIVPRLFAHDRCFIFQNADGRIVFAIPYETDFTLIGTTDIDHDGDPGSAGISPGEIDYLCAAVSEYLEKPVTPADVVHSYSGVRPLYDDGAPDAKSATRDYVLELDGGPGRAVLLSIFGGKITTYRKLAEEVLARLAPYLPFKSGPWTAGVPLPGGAFAVDGFDDQVAALNSAYPFLTPELARRLTRLYGTDAFVILGEATALADLGRVFGADLTEAELRWLIDREWAETAADVVWRRTKLGLSLSPDQTSALDDWMAQYSAARHKAPD